jgi:hypothetical protein
MQFVKPVYSTLFLISFIILLTSCDDNSVTGPDDPSQVPSPPDFSQLQMETGIFTHGGAAKEAGDESGILAALNTTSEVRPEMQQDEEADPFQLASFLVAMVESGYSLHITYATFFTLHTVPGTVEVSGNEFIWEYSAQDPELEETVDITVTAAVIGEDVDWTVMASANLEEGGFDEQQIIEGTSAFDGSSGEWSISFDVPEEGFTYASSAIWESIDHQLNTLDISTSIAEVETGFYQHTDGVYSLEGSTASISNGQIQSPEFEGEGYFGDIDITQPFSVFWDIQSGAGTVSIDGNELCWDENREAVDC